MSPSVPVLLEALPRTELPSGASSTDRAFVDLEQRIVHQVLSLAPAGAVQLGLHAYDGLVPDLSEGAEERHCQAIRRLQHELEGILEGQLLPGARRDRGLLGLMLASDLFSLKELHVLERFPLAYVEGLQLVPYLARPYASPEVRAGAMVRLLTGVPGVLAEGRRRLRDPLPAPLLSVSQAMAAGLAPHYAETERFVRESAPGELSAYRKAREEADAAVEAFLGHLSRAVERATDDFALGPERFQRLLYVREGLTLPWDELRRRGESDLRRNQERLAELAARAPPGGSPAEALAELSRDHPGPDTLLPEARAFTEELRQFVLEKDFVTLPTPEHCRVEETPPVSRAWTTASLDPPGPFETATYEGVYHITPVEPSWEEQKQREWLESFNRPVLRNVTAHEVYPGHYLQLLHFRAHAKSLTRRCFLSGAFVEGWAHYAEQLVVEQGYRAGSPEAEMAQLHDALLRNCRLLASVDMHCRGRSLEEATALFQREGHLARFPAEREALRGTFNPEYFCYTLGKLEILEARRRYREEHPASPLKEFHDHLLALGAPPVGWISGLLSGI
ncbi:protein containing DUF885, bacterial [mine drainage metagenome]|uniref:Protein containing DUF885, bacterial n=1 Tax=mine drainage metagenome TaxID=410659 RepID=T1D4I4_9ZZZZ